jgi:hypothetical protein
MGWPTRIKNILKVVAIGTGVANDLGLPVPNVLAAVEKIHASNLSNDDADALNAAAIDALATRVKQLENRLMELEKKGKK